MQESETSPDESAAVFLVDDDRSVRKALSRLLRSNGMRVRAYESAIAFLDGLPEIDCCCCVLVDINMPGLTGLGLQGRLAELGIRYPIVFITGQPDVSKKAKAMKAGAVDFLVKPFTEGELLATIDRAFALHRRLRLDQEESATLRG